MPTNELTQSVRTTPMVEAMSPSSAVETVTTPETRSTGATAMPIPNLSFEDLQRVVHLLARAQKFQLLQFVVAELAEDEATKLSAAESFESGVEYPIYTPYEQFDAAHALMDLRESRKESASG